MLIDDEPTFKRVKRFFEVHMPDKADLVRLYTGDRPIFTKHNIEEQIERIYKRVVTLKSGGSIAIDQTEALTAIDVNSARSVRSGSSEETSLRTNLEAAEEIARQLRLRDIGGLIVIDFIDMEAPKHNRQVEKAFGEAMSRDKARYDLTRISKLGLMEISRQRLKSAKASSSFMECPVCAGDGTIRTPEAAARSAFRKIQSRVARGELAGARVYLPPEAAMYLLNEKRDDLFRLESRHDVRIEVVIQEEMKPEQFEIEEIRREETGAVPMVTAETVDQAIAEGSLTRTPPRPVEPPGVAALPEEAAAERPRKGRRRRRRRRGQPSEGTAVAEPAPHHAEPGPRPAEPASAREGGNEPVFSEGPESAEAPLELPYPAEVPAEGQAAGNASDAQRPTRRRRRRRRRRSRGGSADASGASSGRGGESRPGGRDDDSAGFHEQPYAAAAPSSPAGAWDREAATPRLVFDSAESTPRSAAAERRTADDAGAGDAPVSESGEAKDKPKRRWWRRPFRD